MHKKFIKPPKAPVLLNNKDVTSLTSTQNDCVNISVQKYISQLCVHKNKYKNKLNIENDSEIKVIKMKNKKRLLGQVVQWKRFQNAQMVVRYKKLRITLL